MSFDDADYQGDFSEPMPSSDDQQARDECLQRFVADALKDEDSQQANVSLVQANVFYASHVLHALLRSQVAEADPISASADQIAQTIELQVKLARETERLAKFLKRFEEQELEFLRHSGGMQRRR